MPVLSEIKSARVPVKIWAPLHQVENSALTQLRNTAMLPYVFKHVAAMPDVHLGTGATVGSVVAMQRAVCPSAVGVDIGCGMMAQRLRINPDLVLNALPQIRSAIEANIPVGNGPAGANDKILDPVMAWAGWARWEDLYGIDRKVTNRKAMAQFGSLGGGNHFIEICLDTEGQVWAMLHSGSRNIGKELAEHHIESAKGVMRDAIHTLPDPALAYLIEGTSEFHQYHHDLMWAQSYAAANRIEMMRRVMEAITEALRLATPPEADFRVNCHHNYVAEETHFGERVLVTRKGAVRAGTGDLGIIPGSMGTKSYIVRGKGNPESFESCSHGAGRRMSRNKARQRFTLADLAEQTKGVECRKDADVIDEIPGAYKDIDEVMANQSDLVEIVATLKQVMCVKG
jgi:tRNA-splicing ligase RtcB